EWACHPPGVTLVERIAYRSTEDAIAIPPRERAPASAEALIHRACRPDRDIRGEQGVERSLPHLRIKPIRNTRVDHLAAGVDPTIRTARRLDRNRLARDTTDRLFESPLHRRALAGGLALEAAEARPVVCDERGEVHACTISNRTIRDASPRRYP